MQASKEYDLGFKAGLEYAQMKMEQERLWYKSEGRRLQIRFIFNQDREHSVNSDFFDLTPGMLYFQKINKTEKLTEIGVYMENGR